jgi:gamma-glutamylcyclotransferase (GGCT)/AIG2-like uncharacterized protein YtfP
MSGQKFVAIAHTEPVYRLYSLGDYPAMVEASSDGRSIEGEVWEVDDTCLAQLDKLEGLDEGLYKRTTIPLLPPNDKLVVEGYLYLLSITGRRDCGSVWSV